MCARIDKKTRVPGENVLIYGAAGTADCWPICVNYKFYQIVHATSQLTEITL